MVFQSPLALEDGTLFGILNSGVHHMLLQGANACYGIPKSVVAAPLKKDVLRRELITMV